MGDLRLGTCRQIPGAVCFVLRATSGVFSMQTLVGPAISAWSGTAQSAESIRTLSCLRYFVETRSFYTKAPSSKTSEIDVQPVFVYNPVAISLCKPDDPRWSSVRG